MAVISFGLNAIFWFLVGMIASILVSIATRIGVDMWYEPELVISDHEAAYENGQVHIRAVVRNDGRSAAHNCTGKLVVDELEPASVITNPSEAVGSPMRTLSKHGSLTGTLAWTAPEDGTNRTINRDERALLSVCKQTDEGLIVPSELGWERPSFVLSSQSGKRYTGTIRVTAEDAPSRARAIELAVGDRTAEISFTG